MSEGEIFLRWYAENYEMMNKALRKNITYDDDLFDDVMGDTVVKVYNAIEKGTKIDDYKNFFFISAKFNYINAQKRQRKREKQGDRRFLSYGDIEDEINTKEEKLLNINKLYNYIAEYIEDYFPTNEVDLFVIYHKLKSNGSPTSYNKMSEITGQSVSYITKTLKKIKDFVRNDENIRKKKKILLG